ncbi:MAG TPA: hypothetical protein VJ964_13210 [Balneolaceae bacterium]|nr:hypothetical protein [Balneolaceae bacterium]
MKIRNKILLGVASIILLGVFLFPLWQIRMQAPQYPEGLGVNIWIHNITSVHPHNIDTINDLNHYIGMKPIEPDAVPELKIMPYIVVFISVVGLIVIWMSNRTLFIGWLIMFAVLATAAMTDFYLWLYDYGHNLDPDAAIKVPGMSYQPPILGSRQLLNIHVNSMPGIGGYLLILSLLIGVYILINELRTNKAEAKKTAIHRERS